VDQAERVPGHGRAARDLAAVLHRDRVSHRVRRDGRAAEGRLGDDRAARAVGGGVPRVRRREAGRDELEGQPAAVPGPGPAGRAGVRARRGRRVRVAVAEVSAMRRLVHAVTALLLAACSFVPSTVAEGRTMVATQLYCGLAKPGGGAVSGEEFDAFLRTFV